MVISHGQEWWTDERVENTVTKHFVYAHLRADQADQLQTPVFAELSDNTYLQWILLKARRLFLILIHVGVPGDILRLIEDSYDDDNLPLDEDDVPSLGLSQGRGQNLNLQFYRCQFKYLVRVIGEGEHIRYASDELVPLQRVDQKIINSQSSLERVKLPSPNNKTFLLKRIQLQDDRTELDLLAEIAGSKSLSHQHTLSVFGSYVQNDHLCLLMLPAARYNLGNFLNDRPKAFEVLAKSDRRNRLIAWPHCLSNALAWLHEKGAHHGAVRPSRIFIDEQFHISLGYFEGDWALGFSSAHNDLESYSYAAPELWKRALTVRAQSTSGSSSTSGGRSAFGRRDAYRDLRAMQGRIDETEGAMNASSKEPAQDQYTFVPKTKGVSSRLRLEVRTTNAPSTLPKRAESRLTDRGETSIDSLRRHHSLCRRYDTNSVRSSNSSERNRKSGTYRSELLYSLPPETKNTAVQTWSSAAVNLPATDVFSLAAVTMDILTVLCSRSVASFAKHRGAKYRQAGRGGSVADTSFHANLSQVGSWAETVHKDAEKKLKKHGGAVFRAVGPILQVIMQCLDRDPQRRMQASTLSQRLGIHLSEFAEIPKTHCSLDSLENIAQAQQIITSDRDKIKPIDQLLVQNSSASVESPSDSQDMLEVSQPVAYDAGHHLKASERLTGRTAPSTSSITSATYYQSPRTGGSQFSEKSMDHFNFYDDRESEDAHYVHVKPREQGFGRLLIDFTDDDAMDNFRSGNASIRPTTTSRPVIDPHSRPNTSNSNQTSQSLFSLYPPASPPPNRQLPASPAVLKHRSHRMPRANAAPPPPSIYQANDLLALAAGNLSIDETTTPRSS